MKRKPITQNEAALKLQEHKEWRIRHYDRRFEEWKIVASKALQKNMTDLPNETEILSAFALLTEADAPNNEIGRVIYELIWEKHLVDVGPLEAKDLIWLSELIDDVCFPSNYDERLDGPRKTH